MRGSTSVPPLCVRTLTYLMCALVMGTVLEVGKAFQFFPLDAFGMILVEVTDSKTAIASSYYFSSPSVR